MNILIIDDHALVKEGIETRIKQILPEANCYFANNARTAMLRSRELEVTLMFCDLEFKNEPQVDGFFIAKSILEFEPRIKIIALTNYNSYRVMKRAVESGFHSFIEKGCSDEEFGNTLLGVWKEGFFESETMKQLSKKRNEFLNNLFSESLYGLSNLSKRERELVLLSSETTDRKILALSMNVTPYTIDTYYKKILGKLDLKHRQDLALFSQEFKEELLKIDKD